MKRVKYQMKFVDLEGGFWGMVDEEGNQFMPMHVHEQLKCEGETFIMSIEPLDVMGMMMWGTPVNIISFTTS